jgi:hypothetical protein
MLVIPFLKQFYAQDIGEKSGYIFWGKRKFFAHHAGRFLTSPGHRNRAAAH